MLEDGGVRFDEIIAFAGSLPLSARSVDVLYQHLLDCFRLDRPSEAGNRGDGVLITLDGHSGAGKDTQMSLLTASLEQGSGPTGRPIIALVQKRNDPFRQVVKRLWAQPSLSQSQDASFLLLTAGRRYFVNAVVRPHLRDPRAVVVQNRSFLSQLAYAARSPAELPDLLAMADFDPSPDLSFVLECEVAVAFARVVERAPTKGGVIYGNERPRFITRARDNFRALGSLVPGLIFIETRGSPESVALRIRQHVDARLERSVV